MRHLAEHGHSALEDVGINGGELSKWGALGFFSHGTGGMTDPKTSSLPVCVTMSDRREPPKLGSTGAVGASLTPRNTLLLLPNLVVLDQTVRVLLRRFA